jgi:hypothetical protein
MSSILDALRRIEREEHGRPGAPFDLGPEKPRFGPRRKRPWATVAVAVALTGTVSGALWLFWPGAADVEPQPPEQLEDLERAETQPGEEHADLEPPEANTEWEASVKAARLKHRKKARGEKRKKLRYANQTPTLEKAAPSPAPSVPEQASGKPAAGAAPTPIREPVGTPISPPAPSDAAPSGPTPPIPALAPTPPTPALAAAPPTEVALAQPQPTGEETLPWKRPFVATRQPEEVAPEAAARVDDADAAPGVVEEDPFAPPDALPAAAEPAAPAATPEPPPVVANIAPGSGVLEPPATAAEMGAVEPPPPAPASPTAEDLSPPSRRKDRTTPPPTRLSRAERLEELKRQLATPREDTPAAPTAPREAPQAPPPSAQPEGEKVLQRLPSGAPKVRVNFLFYSREPARRRIMVTVDNGSLQTLFEGQSVDTLGVERILPNEVHFRYEGKLFAVRPRY